MKPCLHYCLTFFSTLSTDAIYFIIVVHIMGTSGFSISSGNTKSSRRCLPKHHNKYWFLEFLPKISITSCLKIGNLCFSCPNSLLVMTLSLEWVILNYSSRLYWGFWMGIITKEQIHIHYLRERKNYLEIRAIFWHIELCLQILESWTVSTHLVSRPIITSSASQVTCTFKLANIFLLIKSSLKSEGFLNLDKNVIQCILASSMLRVSKNINIQ